VAALDTDPITPAATPAMVAVRAVVCRAQQQNVAKAAAAAVSLPALLSASPALALVSLAKRRRWQLPCKDDSLAVEHLARRCSCLHSSRICTACSCRQLAVIAMTCLGACHKRSATHCTLLTRLPGGCAG
jgi:hypothetical protein